MLGLWQFFILHYNMIAFTFICQISNRIPPKYLIITSTRDFERVWYTYLLIVICLKFDNKL